jgi:hypothetical protein
MRFKELENGSITLEFTGDGRFAYCERDSKDTTIYEGVLVKSNARFTVEGLKVEGGQDEDESEQQDTSAPAAEDVSVACIEGRALVRYEQGQALPTRKQAYIPKVLNASSRGSERRDVLVLEKESGNKWRAANQFLFPFSPGIAYRWKKDLDAKMPEKTSLLEWGQSIEGVDEGDGWVQINMEADGYPSLMNVTRGDFRFAFTVRPCFQSANMEAWVQPLFSRHRQQRKHLARVDSTGNFIGDSFRDKNQAEEISARPSSRLGFSTTLMLERTLNLKSPMTRTRAIPAGLRLPAL